MSKKIRNKRKTKLILPWKHILTVGALVIGTNSETYGLTNNYSICEVVSIDRFSVSLKFLDVRYIVPPGSINPREYFVDAEYFRLATVEELKYAFSKWGLICRIQDKNSRDFMSRITNSKYGKFQCQD